LADCPGNYQKQRDEVVARLSNAANGSTGLQGLAVPAREASQGEEDGRDHRPGVCGRHLDFRRARVDHSRFNRYLLLTRKSFRQHGRQMKHGCSEPWQEICSADSCGTALARGHHELRDEAESGRGTSVIFFRVYSPTTSRRSSCFAMYWNSASCSRSDTAAQVV